MSATSLAQTLSSERLGRLFAIRFHPMDNEEQVMQQIKRWKGDVPQDIAADLYDLSWPMLMELSKFGPVVDDAFDIKTLLPSPSDSTFLPYATAMVMLLDQLPRIYCSTTKDVRWVNDFFDNLAQDLIWHMLILPAEHNVLNPVNWEKLGFDYLSFLVITSVVLSGADHSENLYRHQFLKGVTKARRQEIKKYTDQADPFDLVLSSDTTNIYAFSQWMRRGLPDTQNVSEFGYLRLAVIDLHYPIIEKFGRYPYRNSVIGRTSTREETEFLEYSAHFGEPSLEVRDSISQDIKRGQWTAFGQN